MRTTIRTVCGVLLTVALSTAQQPDGAGADSGGCVAVLAAIRAVCEDLVIDLREQRIVDGQLPSERRVRASKFADCERLEWWGDDGSGVDVPADRPESGAAGRTMCFDGFRQVDWYLGWSKLDKENRSWVALVAAAPTLDKDRPRYLRLLGLDRLGAWLWEPSVDGRPRVMRMLRPDLLLVACPIGDAEVHRGLYACDLVYLDGDSHLPQRILECLPTDMPPETMGEQSLAGLVCAEMTVDGRTSGGVPQLVRYIHRSKDLLDFVWICTEAKRVSDTLRKAMGDAERCPVPEPSYPVRHEDALIAALQGDRKPDPPESEVGAATSTPRSGIDVGTVGLLLVAIGSLLTIVSHLTAARSRTAEATSP